MSTFTVTNTNDSGAGSLRDAINQANTTAGADIINFQSDLAGTITLTSELSITESVTINGTGSDMLTVSGGWSGYDETDGVRLFNVDDGSDSNVINVTISNLELTAGYSASSGGAILNHGETLALVNVVIYDNKSDASDIGEGGGGVFNQGGTLTVVNSSIIANYGIFGGGIANSESGTVSVINSLIADNRAGFGGGIYSWDGSVTLNGVTVAGNVASSDGGGVTNDSGTLTAYNSILALNYTQDGVAFDVSGPFSTDSKNNVIAASDTVIDNGTNGNIVGPVTGLFATAPDAGADAAWGTLDDVSGDYRLAAGSAAIDKGDSSLLPADTYDVNQNSNTAEALPTDMDNELRVVGTSIDIGAFEYEHTPPS
ncbi:MAG: choice-of-anchor Q domain-containing protein, partial [Victivallaceae bacterium]